MQTNIAWIIVNTVIFQMAMIIKNIIMSVIVFVLAIDMPNRLIEAAVSGACIFVRPKI
jgi:hypothetical protein